MAASLPRSVQPGDSRGTRGSSRSGRSLDEDWSAVLDDVGGVAGSVAQSDRGELAGLPVVAGAQVEELFGQGGGGGEANEGKQKQTHARGTPASPRRISGGVATSAK